MRNALRVLIENQQYTLAELPLFLQNRGRTLEFGAVANNTGIGPAWRL